MRPIDGSTQTLLAKQEQITTTALRLTALPDPAAAETGELRAFYRAWLGLNGVIAGAIRSDHGAFFAWVG